VAWQNINLKGKCLFAEGSEQLNFEYLIVLIEEYVPVQEKQPSLRDRE